MNVSPGVRKSLVDIYPPASPVKSVVPKTALVAPF
jgi:hypothetical protein